MPLLTLASLGRHTRHSPFVAWCFLLLSALLPLCLPLSWLEPSSRWHVPLLLPNILHVVPLSHLSLSAMAEKENSQYTEAWQKPSRVIRPKVSEQGRHVI